MIDLTVVQALSSTATEAKERLEAPAISLSGVGRDFPGVRAVDNLSLNVEKAQIFGLLGPNGSGKTTVLNMISGLLKSSQGTVRVFGHDPIKESKQVKKILGVVPQETALYEDLTATENLRFHHALYAPDHATADKDIEEVLKLVYLSDRAKSRVKTFSGGMKRRLALARALLHNPELILFDEPTLGVDVQGTHVIWDKIKELRTLGQTFVITTNVMSEAENLCDELAIMDEGKLVARGTPTELKTGIAEDTIEIELARSLSPDELPSGLHIEAHGPTLLIKTANAEKHLADIISLLSNLTAVLRVEMRKPTLDDVFLHYTGRRLRE